MNEMHVRKSYQYNLTPAPAQERALAGVLRHCRVLYNTALAPRITAGERCRVAITR